MNGFIFGGSTGRTAEDLRKQRAAGQQAQAAGSSTAPASGGLVEGLARMLSGGIGGYFEGEADRAQSATPSATAQSALDAGWTGFGPAPTQPTKKRDRSAFGIFGPKGSTAGPGDYGRSPNDVGYTGGVSANLGSMPAAMADRWVGMRQTSAPRPMMGLPPRLPFLP